MKIFDILTKYFEIILLRACLKQIRFRFPFRKSVMTNLEFSIASNLIITFAVFLKIFDPWTVKSMKKTQSM